VAYSVVKNNKQFSDLKQAVTVVWATRGIQKWKMLQRLTNSRGGITTKLHKIWYI